MPRDDFLIIPRLVEYYTAGQISPRDSTRDRSSDTKGNDPGPIKEAEEPV